MMIGWKAIMSFLIAVVLSGCSMQEELAETSALELQLSPKIICADIEYKVDEQSIYWDNNMQKPNVNIENIYREINPTKAPDFNELLEKIDNMEIQERMEFGNIFVPYLLTIDSLQMTESDFYELFKDTNYDLTIYSFIDDGNYHRVFLFCERKGVSLMTYTTLSYCFIQTWNEKELQAQPVFEGFYFTIEGQSQPISFIANENGNGFLIFIGFNTSDSFKNAQFAPVFLGWEWKSQYWAPFTLNKWVEIELFNNSKALEECLIIKKDGVLIDNALITSNDGASFSYIQNFEMKVLNEMSIIVVEQGSNEMVAKFTFNQNAN